jgi:ABC-2 type transport system permease protein
VSAGGTGLRHALAAEWIKATSVRSTVVAVVATGAVLPVLAVVVVLTGSLQPDDTVTGASLTGGAVAMIAAGVAGALVVSGEYSGGTMRATLAARPDRATVLAAKVVVAGALTVVSAGTGAVAAIVAGHAVLSGHASGGTLPAVVGVAVAVGAVGVLGVAFGTVLRHTAGAVLAVVAVALLPQLLAPLAGDWRGWIAGAGPVAVLQKLAQSSDAVPSLAGTLSAPASLALLTGNALVALLLAGASFRRRDA